MPCQTKDSFGGKSGVAEMVGADKWKDAADGGKVSFGVGNGHTDVPVPVPVVVSFVRYGVGVGVGNYSWEWRTT